MPRAIEIDDAARRRHLDWLLELTQIPSAAGAEDRVIAWIDRWLASRPGLWWRRDAWGNIVVGLAGMKASPSPLYLTAHLDHPAFVVERVLSPVAIELGFRGGVMDDYFDNARVRLWPRENAPVAGRLIARVPPSRPQFKTFACELDAPAPWVRAGDIAVWELPPASVEAVDGVACVCTLACDDLAALAAALAAVDAVLEARSRGVPLGDVRLLLTRAEEIGFLGAIGACKAGTIEPAARLIALENSRSFADSPIGAGPIVRVGDRVSVFSPELTGVVAEIAEAIAGTPAQPRASDKAPEHAPWRWQRKLMAGGACEASVYCAYGLQSTCVCLPLGNYHNMADLAAVQARANTTPPRVGREYIAVEDYHGLVDLLVGCAIGLTGEAPAPPGFRVRAESIWSDLADILAPTSQA